MNLFFYLLSTLPCDNGVADRGECEITGYRQAVNRRVGAACTRKEREGEKKVSHNKCEGKQSLVLHFDLI